MKIINKIALITGGSRGLGKNAALHLAKKGIDVIIVYRSKKEEADEVVSQIEQQGLKSAALQLDVADTKAFPAFIQQLKELLQRKWNRSNFDFLINNAGIDAASPFPETTEEAFDSLFN